MMDTKYLLKYIKGELSSEKDILEILDWIEVSEENQKRYNDLKNLWVITGVDELRNHKKSYSSLTKKKITLYTQKVYHAFTKYAAVFILAFLLGSVSIYFLTNKQSQNYSEIFNKIEVPYGERSLITLYDGTEVWLNSGTTLKYPVVFNSKERKVYIEGEAYFDVQQNKLHPFIVNSGKLEIEVLGTKFNICAYPDDEYFFTTLDEGSVKATCNVNRQGVLLKPGQQAVFSQKANSITQKKVDTDLYTSWKENLLKFENARFEDVIKKMERWYDVKIILDDIINPQEKYTMTIKTESLREMLKVLSISTAMKYKIIEDKVFITKP